MACRNDSGQNGCVAFYWNIENFSYCWQMVGVNLYSPEFTVDSMEDSEWRLCLAPRGHLDSNCIGFFLERMPRRGPESIEVEFDLAFLARDGSVIELKQIEKSRFLSSGYDSYKGHYEFANREDVLKIRKEAFLPQDTLRALCKIWRQDKKVMESTQIFARTIINVERRSFAWNIEKFSTLKPDQKTTFVMRSISKEVLMTFGFSLNCEQCGEDKIIVSIASSFHNIKCFTFECFVLDTRGGQVNCGRFDFLPDDLTRGVSFPLLLTKRSLLNNKRLYLKNDVLSLNCECAFSTGKDYDRIERVNSGIMSSWQFQNVHGIDPEKPQSISVGLKESLKSLYDGGILCDTNLCTSTETFPAHIVVLSAASPVFRAMFTNDMKEKSKGYVEISDLDADTVRQMLQYMYTDTLEDLSWEKALKLYTAADKYEIEAIKKKCSIYLKENLCQTKACEFLVLADMHQDKYLKKVVQDFILEHDSEIFDLDVWKSFMDANPKLAAETLYRNWKKD
ncbi:TD and POZ domain-containing protein 3 [Trichonephila inaurata madagascariensis]|uniref:TD and POZ domain-containing protein 3 n=1 Tax=Trichonephila inaurata madagascariensis TaxID=2747483 RepID=A0A8X6XDH9_9ARAC|nr:TD and POZ domain-containing protein 3 [Trichonephila inaurata madagascariensis]